MPRVDIFLPPLLGGFLFVLIWYPTRYWSQREQGYKIVFAASIAGMFLLFGATVLIECSQLVGVGREIRAWWHGVVGVPHLGKAALAFILGAVAPIGLNLTSRWIPALSKQGVVDWLILRRSDAFEVILRQSLGTRREVLVTLKNDKVYVGRVVVNVNPGERVESFRLLLTRSGYRDDVRSVHLTTNYEEAVDQLRLRKIDQQLMELARGNTKRALDDVVELVRSELAKSESVDPFDVVILASEVRTIGWFDQDAYDTVFTASQPSKAAGAA